MSGDGIEVDVAGNVPKLSVGFDQNGFKHRLKEGTDPVVFSIEIFAVAVEEVAHKDFDTVFLFLANEKVEVVGHKAKGYNLNNRGKVYRQVFFKERFGILWKSVVV